MIRGKPFLKGHKVNIGRRRTIEFVQKIKERMMGKKIAWKGDEVSYRGIHQWVQRSKGLATKCEHCGKEWDRPRSIGWANIDHKYRRNLDDYIALCGKCHKEYDKNLLLNYQNEYGKQI